MKYHSNHSSPTTIRRALSLLALAGSLALAASQHVLTLSYIKALDTTDTNKE